MSPVRKPAPDQIGTKTPTSADENSQPFEHIEPIEPFEQQTTNNKQQTKNKKPLVKVENVQPLRKIPLIKIFLRKMLRSHV